MRLETDEPYDDQTETPQKQRIDVDVWRESKSRQAKAISVPLANKNVK
jgi:hypothetical protein